MPYPSDMVQKDTFYFILDPLNGFNSRIKFIILFDSPSHLPLKKKSPGTQGLTQDPHSENFKGSAGIRTLVSTSLWSLRLS